MRLALLAILALSITTAVLAADVPVKVYVNGALQSYNPPAVMRGGTVYVPLRAGAKSLGINVKWHTDTQSAQICTDKGCTLIRKSQGITVNGSLLLPLRKMGEATGAKTVWDGPNKAVCITR
jgi:hypothetical protein